LITLETLNGMPSSQFVATLGGIFEHSPWVAERAATARPFSSREELLQTMREVVQQASLEEQMALIRAHPHLGARGRTSAPLTELSAREQSRAGLDACTDAEFARLRELNAAYVEKFDFPFILAVRGHDPASILATLQRRIHHEVGLERQTALQQIGLIAEYRLTELVSNAIP
jgi:OHCU decarboxylase